MIINGINLLSKLVQNIELLALLFKGSCYRPPILPK